MQIAFMTVLTIREWSRQQNSFWKFDDNPWKTRYEELTYLQGGFGVKMRDAIFSDLRNSLFNMTFLQFLYDCSNYEREGNQRSNTFAHNKHFSPVCVAISMLFMQVINVCG